MSTFYTQASQTTDESSEWDLKQRFQFIFNSERYCDVHFIVGRGKQKQRVPAHKLVLSVASRIFDRMFSKEWETNDDIAVTDIEPASFLALLKFIYYDQVEITGDTVLSVLYAARKYEVSPLADHCINHIIENLGTNNVFSLLVQARFFKEDKLIEACLKFIDDDTVEAVKTTDFLDIDYNTLWSVLKRDSLRISEFDLFQAILRWTAAECKRQKVDVHPDKQRSVLREALYLIRFPLMSIDEISSGVTESKILTHEELNAILLYLVSKKKPTLDFSEAPRVGPEWVTRSRFAAIFQGWACNGNSESIRFTADRDLQLVGVGFYGSCNGPANYEVSVKLRKTNFDFFGSSTICFKSQVCSHDGSRGTFRVAFDSPAKLKASIEYQIDFTIKGPESYYGAGGRENVSLKLLNNQTVNITFANGSMITRNNLTDVQRGQIPELVFQL